MSQPDISSLPSDNRMETSAGDVGRLTYERLDVVSIQASVQSHQAGAIALFVGTTRDSFSGRKVERLEYEAYPQLVMKTFDEIFSSVRTVANTVGEDHDGPRLTASDNHTSPIIRCAIHHRLGNVPVGEASIIVAVSSPHRKEAFHACEWLLEQVKLKAAVWKREWYAESNDGCWKANFPPSTN